MNRLRVTASSLIAALLLVIALAIPNQGAPPAPLPNQPVVLVDNALAEAVMSDSALMQVTARLEFLKNKKPENVSFARWMAMIDDQQARILRERIDLALDSSRVNLADSLCRESFLLSPSPENHLALAKVLEAEGRIDESLAAWMTGAVLTADPGARVHAESLFTLGGRDGADFPAFLDRYRENLIQSETLRASRAASSIGTLPKGIDLGRVNQKQVGTVLIFWDETLSDPDESIVLETQSTCNAHSIPYRLVYAGFLDTLPSRQARRFGLESTHNISLDRTLVAAVHPARLPAVLVVDRDRQPTALYSTPSRLLAACALSGWEAVQSGQEP